MTLYKTNSIVVNNTKNMLNIDESVYIRLYTTSDSVTKVCCFLRDIGLYVTPTRAEFIKRVIDIKEQAKEYGVGLYVHNTDGYIKVIEWHYLPDDSFNVELSDTDFEIVEETKVQDKSESKQYGHEERKSLPKIDKLIKMMLIEFLKLKMKENRWICATGDDDDTFDIVFKDAIKIIESLEAE